MLITDPTHALPVVIERTGLRTIAYGSRDGDTLTLPDIPLAANVRVGDRLLTSGIGGRFPSGFPVGTILSAKPALSGTFLEAHAHPAADINRTDDVLILHDLADPQGPPAPVNPAGPPSGLAPGSAGPGGAAARGNTPDASHLQPSAASSTTRVQR
jgi:rod shape-determining protein MreC